MTAHTIPQIPTVKKASTKWRVADGSALHEYGFELYLGLEP